jgi:hypothetical protein
LSYARTVQLLYSAQAPVLRELSVAANSAVGFDLRFHPSVRFRAISDHASFHDAGVPIVYPFSGYHADYHQPSDVAARVIPARIVDTGRFVANVVRVIAEHPAPIDLDTTIREAPAPDPFETPYGR